MALAILIIYGHVLNLPVNMWPFFFTFSHEETYPYTDVEP